MLSSVFDFAYDVVILTVIAVTLYIFVMRPMFKNIPALKQFYAEADGIWDKVWALAWKSFTVMWSYILLVFGFFMNQIDNIASVFGDPNFNAQLTSFLSVDTKTLGYVMLGAAILTFAAKMHAISKA